MWVPAAVMRRAQALMVQRDGPGSSGLTVTVRSDFCSATVPLQARSCFPPPMLGPKLRTCCTVQALLPAHACACSSRGRASTPNF